MANSERIASLVTPRDTLQSDPIDPLFDFVVASDPRVTTDGLGRRTLREGAHGNEEENTAIPLARTKLRDEETRLADKRVPEPGQCIAVLRPAARHPRGGTHRLQQPRSIVRQRRFYAVRITLAIL